MSTDGEKWQAVANLPVEDRGIHSMGMFKGKLYAGTGRSWIYRSDDGVEWEKVAELEGRPQAGFTHWVRFLVEFKGALYAGIEGGGVYRTTDGLAWSKAGDTFLKSPGVRGATAYRDTLYVGSTRKGIIWKTKDGKGWQPVFQAPPDIGIYTSSMVVAGDMLYAAIRGHVFRTKDGHGWEEVGHLGPFTIEAMTTFDDTVYAGTLLPPSGLIYKANLSSGGGWTSLQ